MKTNVLRQLARELQANAQQQPTVVHANPLDLKRVNRLTKHRTGKRFTGRLTAFTPLPDVHA